MDKQLLQEAMSAIDLQDIYLYSSQVTRSQDISENDYPDKMFQQNKLQIDGERLELKDENEIKGPELIKAKVHFGARYVTENTEHLEELSEIQATFIALYVINADVSESAVSEFIKYNVIHNVWPFWREFALRTSIEARLPKLVIPLNKNLPCNTEGNQ